MGTVLFPSFSKGGGSSAAEACFRATDADGGCAGTHILRALYQVAMQTPGQYRVLDQPDLTRRGFWPPLDYRIEKAVYVPHNDVMKSFLKRWMHSFDSAVSTE